LLLAAERRSFATVKALVAQNADIGISYNGCTSSSGFQTKKSHPSSPAACSKSGAGLTPLHLALAVQSGLLVKGIFNDLAGVQRIVSQIMQRVAPISSAEATKVEDAFARLSFPVKSNSTRTSITGQYRNLRQADLLRVMNADAAVLLALLLRVGGEKPAKGGAWSLFRSTSGPSQAGGTAGALPTALAALTPQQVCDFEGRTPLHYAARYGNALATRLLLGIGEAVVVDESEEVRLQLDLRKRSSMVLEEGHAKAGGGQQGWRQGRAWGRGV
jgi:hypothetical protein